LRRLGWGVAPVQEGMDADVRDLVTGGELAEGEQVGVDGVDATRTDEPEQVKGTPALPHPLHEPDERRVLEELARFDRLCDPLQRLNHHTPRAEVQVADLRVAHLSSW